MVDWILGEFIGSSSVTPKKIGPKRGWPSGPVAQWPKKKIGPKRGWPSGPVAQKKKRGPKRGRQ